jgi:aryl-alcohol dehydrogenase-like predicted oxidoreductase
MTFGGTGDFAVLGNTGVQDARRQLDLAFDAGVHLVDSSGVYSDCCPRKSPDRPCRGRRDSALVATNARLAMGPDATTRACPGTT